MARSTSALHGRGREGPDRRPRDYPSICSTLDRRSLFAISTNNGGKFSPDEQAVASAELKQRFGTALAPSLATTRLTGDYSVSYKSALDLSRRCQRRGEGDRDLGQASAPRC